MTNSRPITLIVAAGLLLLLLLLAALLPLVGGERLFFMAGRAGGQQFNGRTPGQAAPNFDLKNPPQNQDNFNGNNQGNGTNSGSSQTYRGNFSSSNTGFSSVLRILQRILEWVELGLGILAIVGLWLKKRWGIVLAILISVLIFCFTLTGMFRMFNTIIFIENLAKVLLAAAVTVLVLLPQSRKATAPVQS